MTKNIKYVKYISDFETTVYDGQERTDVWAAATVRLDDTNDYDRVSIHSSIKEFMRYFDKNVSGRRKQHDGSCSSSTDHGNRLFDGPGGYG